MSYNVSHHYSYHHHHQDVYIYRIGKTFRPFFFFFFFKFLTCAVSQDEVSFLIRRVLLRFIFQDESFSCFFLFRMSSRSTGLVHCRLHMVAHTLYSQCSLHNERVRRGRTNFNLENENSMERIECVFSVWFCATHYSPKNMTHLSVKPCRNVCQT